MMSAGKYYIGDLSYVMNKQWEDVCHLMFSSLEEDGEFKLENGICFASYSTYAGDGNYLDLSGRQYSVDAGLIGCIRVEDIDDEKADLEGGQVIEFKEPFETFSEDGHIVFGHIEINTKGSDEEESDYDEPEDEDSENHKYV